MGTSINNGQIADLYGTCSPTSTRLRSVMQCSCTRALSRQTLALLTWVTTPIFFYARPPSISDNFNFTTRAHSQLA